MLPQGQTCFYFWNVQSSERRQECVMDVYSMPRTYPKDINSSLWGRAGNRGSNADCTETRCLVVGGDRQRMMGVEVWWSSRGEWNRRWENMGMWRRETKGLVLLLALVNCIAHTLKLQAANKIFHCPVSFQLCLSCCQLMGEIFVSTADKCCSRYS